MCKGCNDFVFFFSIVFVTFCTTTSTWCVNFRYGWNKKCPADILNDAQKGWIGDARLLSLCAPRQNRAQYCPVVFETVVSSQRRGSLTHSLTYCFTTTQMKGEEQHLSYLNVYKGHSIYCP